ncbi:hypothetical protein [Prevotella sp. 10(H)]|uniref:hypothetical protein n=1 Tax=Prevotella sp. 10(H) TaxID=1158294 RepID=UPI00068ED3B0|nr:hypothetical protein [Prevotella sp. 10(H)]
MKRILNILFLLVIGCIYVYSTPQEPDILIYNGKKYYLNNFYLEEFFADNPEKRPNFESRWTSLWRGYVATFEIENNELFLTKIEIDVYLEDAKKNILNEVFPDSKKVKLDWFTGILWGGNDNKKRHLSFEYDNYCIFEIDKGNIVKEKNLSKKDYYKFKKQQIKAFEKTDEYNKCIESVKDQHVKQIQELREYAVSIGDLESAKDYGKSKLSDKEAKEFIHYNIFGFTTTFIE